MSTILNSRDRLAEERPIKCVVFSIDPGGEVADAATGSFASSLKAALAGASVEWAMDIEAAFRADSQDPVLVLSRAPITSLAAALAESNTPDTAVEQWIGIREALLARFSRARRRVTILDIGLFARDDVEAWSLVCQRLGIDAIQQMPTVTAPADLRAAPIYEIAAAALIRRDPRAAQVAEALQVAMIGTKPAEVSVAPVIALVSKWHENEIQLALMADHIQAQMCAGTEAQREIARALDESARFRQDLSQAVADKESANRRMAKLVDSEAQAQAELARLQRAQQEAELAAADESNELGLLRENVTLQVQANEALTAVSAELRNMVGKLKGRLRNEVLLQATNEALEHRLVTQEATALRNYALLGSRLLDDASATGAAAIERQLLETRLAALEADRAEVAGALAEAKERLAAIGTMMDNKERNKVKLKAELAKVFNSEAWRLTAPLRTARYSFSSKPRP